MKNSFLIIGIAIVVSLIPGCSDKYGIIGIGEKADVGMISLSFLSPPVPIQHVIARLSRPGYHEIVLLLSGQGDGASGTFLNIPVGQWHLVVEAFNDSNVVCYSGEAEVQVLSAQTTQIDLALVPPNGVLEIHVWWCASCITPPPDCVSWWSGDGETNDLVRGNSGYPQNGMSYSPGMVGQAFHFDGVDDRLMVPDAPNLRLTKSLTIEGWIYIESLPIKLGGQILFRGDDRLGLDPYSLAILPDGNLQFHIGSLTSNVEITTPVPTGRFLHVAATLDSASGSMKLFKNGNIVAEATTVIRPFKDLDSNYYPGLGIGNTQGPRMQHNHPFHGLIDELAVYNRALSSDEIRLIYRAGGCGKCKPYREYAISNNQ